MMYLGDGHLELVILYQVTILPLFHSSTGSFLRQKYENVPVICGYLQELAVNQGVNSL